MDKKAVMVKQFKEVDYEFMKGRFYELERKNTDFESRLRKQEGVIRRLYKKVYGEDIE